MRRRDFIEHGIAATGLTALGPVFWRRALTAPAAPGPGPYGPPGPPDANGIRLPPGFRSRVVARAGRAVGRTGYVWHRFPDGQATFATDDGGWILVSNSEALAGKGGGASAIRFAASGSIEAAYRICSGTNANCAGGATPWGTWLTCEEFDLGGVWECDPLGVRAARNRPALGAFNHESVAVDPVEHRLYMTEDERDGGLYRFTPVAYPDLSRGRLEIARVDAGAVRWVPVPDPGAIRTPTRRQVLDRAAFAGGEGIWFDSRVVYFSTKGDGRVWAYDTATRRLEALLDGGPDRLDGPDNLTVAPSGDLFVCEDTERGAFGIRVVSPEREVAPFAVCEGDRHAGSEAAGVVFDPSGTRLYFSSQRADRTGAVYEVTGPFRGLAGWSAAPAPLAGPSGDGGSTREDAAAPGLGVRPERRRLRLAQLRDGLTVQIAVDGPAAVEVALRTSDLDTRPGRRGSTRRPVTRTLARGRARVRDGVAMTLPVELARVRRALDRRRAGSALEVRARLVVQARDDRGEVRVANVRITLTG